VASLGSVAVDADVTQPAAAVTTSGSRVAICMATYNPDPVLFRRQVESIRSQTHEDFVCLVSDDGSDAARFAEIEQACAADTRFVLHAAGPRRGFYRNFERCLSLVPADVPFVALSDHDDAWHPDKLAALLASLRDTGAVLSYSDMNIVSEDGRLLAPSYWTRRRNNYTDLGSLILANTVTGAASLFRRELLDDVLPFPPDVGHPYHDHWIACVALASGALAYVDRPLHDYVQHGANIIGHYAPESPPRSAPSRAVYFADVVRLQLFAATLQLRLGDRLTGERAAIVRRIARLSESPGALLWLAGRRVRHGSSSPVTLGAERQLLRAIAWRDAQQLRGRARRAVRRRLSRLRTAGARRRRRR
jgi:glycosyltransferase involved in cell wall biosynthesis